MPRWALGTLVVSPLATLLGQGKVAVAVQTFREMFVFALIAMSVWLVLGLRRNRKVS